MTATADNEVPPAEVPEASPDSNNEETKPATPNSRRNLYLMAGVAFVIAAVLSITLPLTLGKSSNNNNNSNQSTANSNDSRLYFGPGADEESQDAFERKLPLFGQDITEGYESEEELEAALAIAFEREASAFIARSSLQFQEQQQWQQSNGSNNNNDDGPGRDEGMMEDSESHETPQMSQNMTSDSAAMDDGSGGGSTADVTDFATNNQEENVDEADIIKADANFVYAAYGDNIIVWDLAGNQVGQVDMPAIDLPDNWGKQQPQAQEGNVDATDEDPNDEGEKVEFADEGIFEVDPEPTTTSSSTKSMMAQDYMYWKPEPRIESMLLTDNHLVVLVTGYGDDYSWGDPNAEPREQRVLYGYRASQVRLYEKSATGALTFVGKKDVNGNFVDARSIGNVVHLATTTTLDVYTHLWNPLERYNFDKNMTDDAYVMEAMTMATTKLIPAMTRKLAKELQVDGTAEDDTNNMPTMLQINQWMTTLEGDTGPDGPGFSMPFQQYDVVSNVAQVTSFDVTAALVNGDELDASASTYMAPSYFDTLYGTEDRLVLATSGWDWNAELGESQQTTYLVALEINGASTEFLSVGTLDGHLLNSYALDIVGDELRAATTVERNRWWWGRPMPMMMMEDDVMVDVEISRPTTQSKQLVGADVDPKGLCPTIEDDACVDEINYQECLIMVSEGCVAIDTMESCPLQFSCALYELSEDAADAMIAPSEGSESTPTEPWPEPEPESDESRTENYMIVMNMVSGTQGLMSEKGRVQIGLKNEVITAVRFFDNVAYAVTFERTDPFYVLDMSGPTVLGELKLPGFSSYLHSMNADNTQLIAVGQNATDDGRETGLMVTVFDATDPANPFVLQSHTFENADNAYSSSNVQWDYKAFRYVAGKLIVPMSIYYSTWNQETQQNEELPEGVEDFEGFAVLDVNANEITEQFRVSHKKEKGSCSCGGYLPTRSFVYSGDLMTVQDRTVVSTNLDSGEEVWRVGITVEGDPEENNQCCW